MKHTHVHCDKTYCHSEACGTHRRRRLLLGLATVLCLGTSALFVSLFLVHAEASSPEGTPKLNFTIPPLPSGVVELKFSEFFVQPVGPRGLELSEKMRRLEGQRVRILGYMAQRLEQPPGSFVLTPFAMQVYEDFPASAVQVSVPTLRGQTVPYASGLMLLTGTLTTGNYTEPDGRISLVRLALDPPEKI